MKQIENITLGLIQTRCDKNKEINLENTLQQIRAAKQKGAQIVCLEELFMGPYFCQENNDLYFSLAEEMPGANTERLAAIAKELEIVIVASFFEKEQLPTQTKISYYNTACVLDADGSFLGKYRKVHIPDDLKNFYSELYYFKPGNTGYPIFKTRYANIGVQVCWDQWYPEGARSLALQGAQIIFYPTAIGWPNTQRQEEIGPTEFNAWVTIQRSHAIANNVFVAACNRIGQEENLNFWGGSFVADPLGRLIAQASHDHEEILIASCDLSEIEKVRQDWPFLSCRRPSEYIKS